MGTTLRAELSEKNPYWIVLYERNKFVKEVTRMSYIKRLFVDRIVDLYDNGEKPEHIAKILSISEEDVRVITDEFE